MTGWMRRLLLVAAACSFAVGFAAAPTPATAMDAAVEDAGAEQDAAPGDAGDGTGEPDAAADASDFHPAVDDGGCRVAGSGSRGGVLALILSAALLGFSGRRRR
jgi:hypothetical protein